MRKQFKSIVAVALAILMLMSVSMPVMAAGHVHELKEDQVLLRGTNETRNVLTPNIYFNDKVYLKSGQILDNDLYLNRACRTVQYKVDGISLGTSGQGIVFQFKNNETQETGSFTLVSDQAWDDTTYLTPFPAGHYTLSVVYAGKSGNYWVSIGFLP